MLGDQSPGSPSVPHNAGEGLVFPTGSLLLLEEPEAQGELHVVQGYPGEGAM